MYLKDLTLRGFKSFASTTTLRFEPGITAIVGPNGSGKSNVVDALAWVMGEQGAKSLRGANMADVIFAGAADRPALGRAQVDLTIDNGDGKLPIPYSEVTITRTMFRSGGSEYAINGQTVRLLDVQELLSDTGMGRQMHIIVGQGMLDSVLSATPEQRRSFIDEAAGVAKYRKRKDRAVSKLAGMDANLVRVLDLTDELKRGLAPLRRAARAARQAAGTQALLAYAGARLIGDDATDATRRLQSEKDRLSQLRGGSEGSREQVDGLRERIRGLRAEAEQTQMRVGASQEVYRDLVAQRDRFASIIELAEEKKRHAGRLTVGINDETIQRAQRVSEEAEQQAEQLSALATEARGAFHQVVIEREECQAELRVAQEQSTQAAAAHKLVVEKYRKVQQNALAARERVGEATREVEGAKQRLSEATGRLETARSEAGATEADKVVAAGPSDEAKRFEAATLAEDKLQAQLAEAREAQSALNGELSALEAEIEALQRSVDGRRSTGKEATASSFTPGRRGRLGDYLSISSGWEEAVQALLGALLDAWLVDDSADLIRLSEHLPANLDAKQAGASGYVAGGGETALPGAVEAAGVQPAVNVVQGRGEAEAAVAALLSDHYVADNNQKALQAVEKLGVESVIATKGGSLISARSVLLRPGPETSTLVLRAEIEDATERLTACRQKADDARERVSELTDQLAAARTERAEALRALRAADAEKAEEEKEAARLSALLHAAISEVERAKTQVEVSEAKLASLTDALREAELAMPDQAPAEKSVEQLDAEEAQKVAAERLERVREAENEARMAAHISEERAAAAGRQAKQHRTQVKTLMESRRVQEEEQRKALRTRSAVSDVIEQARAASERADSAAKKARQIRDDLDSRRSDLQEQVKNLGITLGEEENRSASLGEALLQTEVVHAQTEARVEQIRERAETLLAEYGHILVPEGAAPAAENPAEDTTGVAPVDAIDFFMTSAGPHLPWLPPEEDEQEQKTAPVPYNRAEAEQTYEAAKRKLARLGVVNPLAVEEYDAAKERLDYLTGQVEDINESKAHLLRLIDQIDEEVKLAFEEAFADTSRQFEDTFSELFPGGEGRLELTEPESPLTTGVEIYARPAGKRVTRLSLLSGGERSLAALAYLISIFRARPSPFYVLDEVEAALDDVNLTRVLTVLERLRESSQLLIVTHQKRTMEGADALYGVSMQEGISKVISHKMD